jgi:hypothetical protein
MSEPQRRPIFWFLWPRPDPHAPVDGDVRQTRWVRVCRQGPWRLAMLVPLTLLAVSLAASVVLAVATTGGETMQRIAVLVVVGIVTGLGLALMLRAWVVGTYVNDHGAKVSRLVSAVAVPWSRVDAIHRGPGRALLFGLLWRTDAVRVDLVLDDGTVLPTHVTSVSPDLLGRPEAFDMASLRLVRWWEEAGGQPR